MKMLVWTSATALLCSCVVQKVTEPPPVIRFKSVSNHSDTFSRANVRFVFSPGTCEELNLRNAKGDSVPVDNTGKARDQPHCYCSEFTDHNVVMRFSEPYKGKTLYVDMRPDGSIMLKADECQKFLYKVNQKWGDTIPSVIWQETHQATGMFYIFIAEHSSVYPYYKPGTLDSFAFDLNAFCSASESEEERKNNQELFEKFLRVHITPNPFSENFEMTIFLEKIRHLFTEAPVILTFYDDTGNELQSQPVEYEKTYTFRFPDTEKGKMLYYKIRSEYYTIGGKVLKN